MLLFKKPRVNKIPTRSGFEKHSSVNLAGTVNKRNRSTMFPPIRIGGRDCVWVWASGVQRLIYCTLAREDASRVFR